MGRECTVRRTLQRGACRLLHRPPLRPSHRSAHRPLLHRLPPHRPPQPPAISISGRQRFLTQSTARHRPLLLLRCLRGWAFTVMLPWQVDGIASTGHQLSDGVQMDASIHSGSGGGRAEVPDRWHVSPAATTTTRNSRSSRPPRPPHAWCPSGPPHPSVRTTTDVALVLPVPVGSADASLPIS